MACSMLHFRGCPSHTALIYKWRGLQRSLGGCQAAGNANLPGACMQVFLDYVAGDSAHGQGVRRDL